MTDKQKKLYKAIDEILWKDWDPIGVNDIEDVRDEYFKQSFEITPRDSIFIGFIFDWAFIFDCR